MIHLRNFLPFLFVIVHSLAFAQIKANISAQNYELQSVDLLVEDVLVKINQDGEISGFQTGYFDGEVDYYDDANFDAYRFGKLKKIGHLKIDYWDTLDKSDLKYGKIKNIGTVEIEYYDSFEREKSGKVKKIGNLQIDYWDRDVIDNSRLGKLKSIDHIRIDYGLKDIIDSSKYRKLIKFGSVNLEYWNDKVFDKEKYGKLKLIKGNTKDVSVNLVW